MEHGTNVDDPKEETQIPSGSDDGTKPTEDLNSETTDETQT